MGRSIANRSATTSPTHMIFRVCLKAGVFAAGAGADEPVSIRSKGSRRGRTIALRRHPGVSVVELGFSLHARTTGADDSRARDQLVKYVLRPPLAQERLTLLPNELVRLVLKRPFKDGTVAIDMDPLSLLDALGRRGAAAADPSCQIRRRAGRCLEASPVRRAAAARAARRRLRILRRTLHAIGWSWPGIVGTGTYAHDGHSDRS
jgi:hypothetical protein